MNREKFQALLSNPDAMEDEDILQLQQVVRDYPYFHMAHLLLLYGLNHQNTARFDEQLGHSALYLSSRKELVDALILGWPKKTSGDFGNTQEVELSPVIETIPDQGSEKEQPPSEVLNTTQEVPREYLFEESISFSLEETQPIEALESKGDINPGRQDNIPDLLDFELNSGQEEKDELLNEDLIEHFLKVNPRIVPKLDLEDTRGDISTPGLEENDEIVTETLAQIYEQQGHISKSIEAYRKLILKFPEKSTYFASRIEELEKRSK